MSNTTNFKVGESVQLLHGFTPTMAISEIKETKAFCVWFETKTKKMHQEWLPLNSLKHTPPKPSLEGLIDASYRR